MEPIEIGIVIIGILLFAITFIIPEKKETQEEISQKKIEELIEEQIQVEIDAFRLKTEEVIDETVSYATDKSERIMERLSNEKIHEMDEYSATVLKEIHRNHEETMFLYDMLVQKEKVLKSIQVAPLITSTKEVKVSQEIVEPELATSEPAITAIDRIKNLDKLAKVPELQPKEQEVDHVIEAAQVTETEQVTEITQSQVEILEVERAESTIKEATSSVENNNQKILERYGKGMDYCSIAKELGLGIGEVKLVVGLFEEV
ncbi:MAG: DUF6115 domain-containing protein [Eubacteriales bacterium]